MAEINYQALSDPQALGLILDSILVDLTALKAAIAAMATKLNSDAGVTDTNYAAAAALTTTT